MSNIAKIGEKVKRMEKYSTKKPINSEVGVRRGWVKAYVTAGLTTSEIARKLEVNEKTVRNDKMAFRESILERFQKNVVEDYIVEVHLQVVRIIRQAWDMHLDRSNNENVRLGATRVVLDALTSYGDLLKQLGLLKDNAIINIFNQQNNIEGNSIFNFISKEKAGDSLF